MPVGGTYRINGWTEAITFNSVLTIVSCYKCGITYAIPEELDRRLLRFPSSSKTPAPATYCPNGHGWVYTGEDEATRLRRRAESAEQELAIVRRQREEARVEIERSKRHAAAMKGQLTKVRNRIKAGICPVQSCRANLGDRVRDHIAHEHPEFPLPADD